MNHYELELAKIVQLFFRQNCAFFHALYHEFKLFFLFIFFPKQTNPSPDPTPEANALPLITLRN